jgi:hypothetical protein
MSRFLLYPAFKNLKEHSDIRPAVHNQPSYNANEGSEFLDDAIRMEDLSSFYTEESISIESHQKSIVTISANIRND